MQPYPLDVLGAESEGMIGYLLEQELVNALGGRAGRHAAHAGDRRRATIPRFAHPTKSIGPVYDRATASSSPPSAAGRSRPTARTGAASSPRPSRGRSSSSATIRLLVDAGVLVVCVGGGGIPVVVDRDGRLRGVEAVIDKDRAAALLARGLGADALLLLTDVAGRRAGLRYAARGGDPHATADELLALDLPDGSMGPKVEAAAWFSRATGGRAAIGGLADAAEVLAGRSGTTVVPSRAEVGADSSHEPLGGL